ncbi:hypothetical protein EVA_22052 [gut metagenome]|uniref:Uncharacterized protein n=1 Tax=gut metagenome TaxID=749906 RepID=J9BQI4_9ZZZZ
MLVNQSCGVKGETSIQIRQRQTVYCLSIELYKPSTDIAYKKINRLLKSGKDILKSGKDKTIGLALVKHRFSLRKAVLFIP